MQTQPNPRSRRYVVAALAAVIILGLGYWLLAPWLSSAAAPEIEGVTWQLVSVNGQPAVPGSHATVAFNGGKVGGSGGVNQFGGSYRASGGSLAITDLASTMMASADAALNQQEEAVLSILQGQSTYRVSGGQLELRSAAGTLIFRA